MPVGTLNYVDYKYLINRDLINMRLCPVFADQVTLYYADMKRQQTNLELLRESDDVRSNSVVQLNLNVSYFMYIAV